MIKCVLQNENISYQERDLSLEESAFHKLARRLRAGDEISDQDFDQIYPIDVWNRSEDHWSPIDVIKRAVTLLGINKDSRILDIGAGPGKFCIIGSLISEGTYVGVEKNKYLVDIASFTTDLLGAKRCSFVNDDMSNIDWSSFNCFYFYNPFGEYLDPPIFTSDFTFIGEVKFRSAVHNARQKLSQLAVGSKVVTFHGYGDRFPRKFSLVHSETFGSGILQLRIKVND